MSGRNLRPRVLPLRGHNVKPEFKFIHVTEHGIEFCGIAGHFDIAIILRLSKRHFFQDDFIQRIAVEGHGRVSVFRFGVRRVVQHAIFQFQLVFTAVAAEVDVKHRFCIRRFFTVNVHRQKEAVSENIMAGNAMSRRASYMYGNLLKPNAKGQVGAGLGTTTSAGTVTLIPPTDYITHTGQEEVIDGLTYDFMMAPGSEAPSEMLWYVKEKKMIEAAEDVTHTLHNTYSLRGAKIRDPLAWSKYINAAIERWGADAEVIIAQHHWPTWGNENIVKLMKGQRDMYRYINDQTLRMANKGLTRDEIAAEFKLPESLEKQWASRGYYGSVSHDVKATYVFYLGWFDGNPATLDELPPELAAKKFVQYMGGADAIMQKAKADYQQGNYRWVAQVVSKVVFADPNNQAARNLEADALEQLGYQAEAGTWRNFYLTGAQELRNGVKKLPTPNTASPDTVRAMTPEMFFDYLGVHINGVRAGNAKAVFNVDLGKDGGKYKLELENGVLNHTANAQAKDADATITLDRTTLNNIILKKETLKQAMDKGDVKVSGNGAKLEEMLSYMDTFDFWFNIVTP